MKILILISLCLIQLSSNLSAQQTFCPPGAIWHYEFSAVTSGGFVRVEYSGDTLINGIQCKKLNGNQFVFTIPNNSTHTKYQLGEKYIYQNGDTVFQYFNNSFYILFNFGAQVGDEWQVADQLTYQTCDTNSFVHVDSIGVTNINGQNLRWVSVHSTGQSSMGFNDQSAKIIERIGPLNSYLFPSALNCDTTFIMDLEIRYFHCYEDSTFLLYNPLTNDCEYWLTLGIEEFNSSEQFSLYPNPISGSALLNVAREFEQAEIIIYNLLGELIRKQKLNGSSNLIHREDMAQGLYILKIRSKEKELTGKFIVD